MIRFLLFSVSFFITFSLTAQLATVDGTTAGTGNALDPNVAVTGFSRGAGISQNAGGTYNSNGFQSNTSRTADDYIEFTISANPGYDLQVTTLDVRYDRSNSGPTQLEIDAIGSGGPVTIFTDASVSSSGENNQGIDISALAGELSITFRIYPFDASSTGGTFDIEVLTGAAGSEGVVINGSAPLPVTLTTFNAKPTSSGAMLEWTTASEENNDYFAVEMSRDATRFSESAQVKGNGTTESLATYSYEFSNLAAGTYYFRLRQVDYDGQFSYSDVVSLEVAGRDFKMFSSLVHETLQIDAEDPRPVRVLNMAGIVVAEFNLTAGRNRLDVSNLVGGMYILSDGINAQRFIK